MTYWNYKKISCLIVSLLLLLLCFSGCNQTESTAKTRVGVDYTKAEKNFDASVKASKAFQPVAENDSLQLFVNGETAEIKIHNKTTGADFYTNPQNRDTYDDLASGVGKDLISAQMEIGFTINDSPQSYNSYTDAISKGQYSFEKIENGIRVNFQLGEKPKLYLFPQVLSKQRFKELLGKMDATNQAVLNRYYKLTTLKGLSKSEAAVITTMYPILEKRDSYIVMVTSAIGDPNKVYASDYILTKLNNAFVSGGYTVEDYYKDNEENLIVEEKKEDLTVTASIEYKLEKEGFSATVPNDSIGYNQNYIKLSYLSLLPMFGCADNQKQGYIFVPDGSGALINLNNGKLNNPTYSKRLYGRDNTVSAMTPDTSEQTLAMPVFGIKADDNAYLAIITSGDGIAEITADIAGRINKYNTVNPVFHINSSAKPTTTSLGMNVGLKYQKEIAGCDLSVRYQFLEGVQADYVGMAKAYQGYLLENGLLTKQNIDDRLPLSITTMGAVNGAKTVAGIPVDAPLRLTSYEDNIRILDLLKEKDVKNIILKLSAWCNYGVKNTAFNKIELISELGGTKKLKELISYLKANNITAYYEANVQTVGKTELFSGYNGNRQSARNLENIIANEYDYELSTKTIKEETRRQIVSPLQYGNLLDKTINGLSAFDIKNIDFSGMGQNLYGDYNENRQTDRDAAKNIVAEELYKLAKNGLQISVNTGNIYSLKGVSLVFGAPDDSGNNYLFDSEIPFYQIVLHGIVPYTGSPINMSSDYRTEILKTVEYGAIPAFQWIYEDNLVLKNTDYNFYSINYKSWIELAAKTYQELNETLPGVQRNKIKSHEILENGIRKTTYENNVSVYVNYSDTPAEADGVKIGAKDFAVKKNS